MASSSNLHEQQLHAAHQNVDSYQMRHSTIAASIFFRDWDAGLVNSKGRKNKQNQWMSLPSRLSILVHHYQENEHVANTEVRSVTLSSDPMEARRISLTASIVANAPNNLWKSFQVLFRHILNFYLENNRHGDEDDNEDEAMGESVDNSEYDPPSTWWDVFDFDEEEFYNCVKTLQWLNPFNSSKTNVLTRPLMQAIHEKLSEQISSEIAGVYDQEGLFLGLQSWVQEKLLPVLSKLLRSDDDIHNTFEEQINHILSECYCTMRQSEIFDIIKNYPDSLPAIIDLNHVLQKTHTMNALISALKDTFRKRLLHPGAQTNQILQVYMNTIKVLRIIDPTDCLLEHVSHGVKSYLRERGDTVRCIISSLTDEEALGGDLYEELQRQDDVRPLEEARYDSDEEEEMPGWDWSPTPSLYYQRTSGSVNVDDEEGMASRDGTTEKAADLLSMLVGIYGSNDLFVDEYRLMLADKLLANIDFDTDREVHNLELLKKRFGESCMRQCEIMIKDMDDSKRIAANIHSTIRGRSMEEENNVVVDVAIVSHIFWPPLQKDSMKNHP